jgi:hypothetical protein
MYVFLCLIRKVFKNLIFYNNHNNNDACSKNLIEFRSGSSSVKKRIQI